MGRDHLEIKYNLLHSIIQLFECCTISIVQKEKNINR